ncbi:MAG: glycosyltransferase [Thermodesulfobacteriota bacterium]
MESSLLSQLNRIGEADLLIGIPSYNNVRTIGRVIRAVMAGLTKYFPNERAVIINSDGGSTDGTQDEVRRVQIEDYRAILTTHPIHPIHKIVTPYHGIPGKGSAFRVIFEVAIELRAKACAVVDSDLRSITPEWVELLLRPIYEEGFDYVSPLYARHKFDGTITNSIVYPLTRALYGKRIRQPIGGDFGFSGKLAQLYLAQDVWETDVARFGIDIWMATLALAEGYKICQSYLGAKIHDAKDPGRDLSSMFTQVISSVFGLMENYHLIWKEIHPSQPVHTFGFQYEVGLEPISVNVERMVRNFQLGVKDLMEIWRKVLPHETAHKLHSIARLSDKEFFFPQELWVQIVYDFAIAYHQGVVHREHLIKSMIPLYLGKVASFVKENMESSPDEVEGKIEFLCQTFEKLKPYLIERWK